MSHRLKDLTAEYKKAYVALTDSLAEVEAAEEHLRELQCRAKIAQNYRIGVELALLTALQKEAI